MKIIQLITLLAAVALSTAAPKDGEEEERLEILSISPEKLRAMFHTGTDEGLSLISEVTEHENYVSVRTFGGVELFSARSFDTSSVLWKILGYSFFLYNNTVEMAEYVVPPSSTEQLEKDMKQPEQLQKAMRFLDTETVNSTKESAFAELLFRPEMDDAIDMFEAFGVTGINGNQNPAALNFYGMILNFEKLRRMFNDSSSTPEASTRQKRHGCHVTSYYGAGVFIRDHCVRCPIGSRCKGMCGPGCTCRRYICGSCCYNQGCYDHDNCCEIFGPFHHSCAFAFPTICSGHRYRCSYFGK